MSLLRQRAVRLQETVIRQFEAAVRLEAANEQEVGTNTAQLRVRVRVLEEQLAANARETVCEVGRLKLRIQELETSDKRQRPPL